MAKSAAALSSVEGGRSYSSGLVSISGGRDSGKISQTYGGIEGGRRGSSEFSSRGLSSFKPESGKRPNLRLVQSSSQSERIKTSESRIRFKPYLISNNKDFKPIVSYNNTESRQHLPAINKSRKVSLSLIKNSVPSPVESLRPRRLSAEVSNLDLYNNVISLKVIREQKNNLSWPTIKYENNVFAFKKKATLPSINQGQIQVDTAKQAKAALLRRDLDRAVTKKPIEKLKVKTDQSYTINTNDRITGRNYKNLTAMHEYPKTYPDQPVFTGIAQIFEETRGFTTPSPEIKSIQKVFEKPEQQLRTIQSHPNTLPSIRNESKTHDLQAINIAQQEQQAINIDINENTSNNPQIQQDATPAAPKPKIKPEEKHFIVYTEAKRVRSEIAAAAIKEKFSETSIDNKPAYVIGSSLQLPSPPPQEALSPIAINGDGSYAGFRSAVNSAIIFTPEHADNIIKQANNENNPVTTARTRQNAATPEEVRKVLSGDNSSTKSPSN